MLKQQICRVRVSLDLRFLEISAERQQSLGFDWHPECLRCHECGKRLNPGQHAEHKGVSKPAIEFEHGSDMHYHNFRFPTAMFHVTVLYSVHSYLGMEHA